MGFWAYTGIICAMLLVAFGFIAIVGGSERRADKRSKADAKIFSPTVNRYKSRFPKVTQHTVRCNNCGGIHSAGADCPMCEQLSKGR